MRRRRETKFLAARLAAFLAMLLPAALLAAAPGQSAGSNPTPRRAAPAQPAKPARCLDYQPSVVRLSGTLVTATYPGPPNFESFARGDRPDTFTFLVLSRPICVEADLRDPDMNPAEKSLARIQLVFTGIDDPGDPDIGKKAAKLIGKRVIVTGSLFGAENPGQHTPALLIVAALARAN